MKHSRSRMLWSVLLVLSTLVACGGESATPTPVVIVVTPSPTQPQFVTVVVTPPPPQQPTAEGVEPTPSPPEPAAPTPPPPPPLAGIELREATFAHGLTEEMQPVDPGADFAPDETIYLSLRVKGRPKGGLVTAQFYWRDSLIAEADVDLADINSGLIFSIGEDTYVGYTLTHDEPFPLSGKYYADVTYGELFLGSYPFRVIPPAEAIPSQIRQVTLAQGVDEDYDPVEPTTTFAVDDEVHLVGRGDLGLATWLQADWYVGSQLDEVGTRSLTLEENLSDVGFAFSYLPEGGWPSGEHSVVLTMNDEEIGRYTFTVQSSSGAVPFDEAAFWTIFPLPEDAEVVPVIEGFDLGVATGLTEPEVFDTYASWLRGQGWRQQAPTEAMVTLPHQIWRRDRAELVLEIRGLDEKGRTVVWAQLITEES